MPEDRPLLPRWHEVVRSNPSKTLGLVAAQSGSCLKIQRDELRLVPGRSFQPTQFGTLTSLDLGTSWFLGVLLCPGDVTDELVSWAKKLGKKDRWRIRFYYVAGTKLADALRAWFSADLPDAPTFKVEDFASFHRLFGLHHADVVYRDATRAPST